MILKELNQEMLKEAIEAMPKPNHESLIRDKVEWVISAIADSKHMYGEECIQLNFTIIDFLYDSMLIEELTKNLK